MKAGEGLWKVRFLALLIVAIFLSGCAFPARRVVSYQGTFRPGGNFVRGEDRGFAILGLIDVDKVATGVEISSGLKDKYQCARLSNIEVTYTDWFFILFSLPTTMVTASCLKEGGALD
ncbi:MAG: hypothetical protein HY391_00185 [Deltaproteobacteria bacterium]|nr:hypothetical protein [Deltaproteobacteria bacterium]